jgi:hypothetical protein
MLGLATGNLEVEGSGAVTTGAAALGALTGLGDTWTVLACCSNMASFALTLKLEVIRAPWLLAAGCFLGVEGSDGGRATSLGSTDDI